LGNTELKVQECDATGMHEEAMPGTKKFSIFFSKHTLKANKKAQVVNLRLIFFLPSQNRMD